MDNKKEFPDWDTFYKENENEKMPWFVANLDEDLKEVIEKMNLSSGNFLDLGTGPGTQAVELNKVGFSVTGTDLSENAISKAKNISKNVNFVTDDILNSKLESNSFDFILDRGCFHVFEPSLRNQYLEQILRILRKNGFLFLKCISDKEKDLPDNKGPHRISKKEIIDVFSNYFEIKEMKETVYYGTLNPLPKALFVSLKKK